MVAGAIVLAVAVGAGALYLLASAIVEVDRDRTPSRYHGLSKGTKLLLPSPSASNDQAIGVMEVMSNDQLRSKLAPSSDDAHPLIDKSAVPVGA